jgi:hypothetical protein
VVAADIADGLVRVAVDVGVGVGVAPSTWCGVTLMPPEQAASAQVKIA